MRQGLYDSRYEHDSCGVGFVVDVQGNKTHRIVEHGIRVLERLAHRGAVGADPKTGDGAGILIQIPHDFCLKTCEKAGIPLPGEGEYGTGLVFFPRIDEERLFCRNAVEEAIRTEGQMVLGWRPVPVDDSEIGEQARRTQPAIEQVFIGRGSENGLGFEAKLYVIRKRAEKAVQVFQALPC